MFEPRSLLKRLNRLIESFVPAAWTRGGEKQRRPSPEEMRRLLLSEAKMISKQLNTAFAGHGDLLKELIEDLARKPDAQLQERWDELCQELLSIRRALYRLILARQSRTELMNEWNDWERHGAVSGGKESPIRHERQEMIASELRLRGIKLPEPKQKVEVPELVTRTVEVKDIEPITMAQETVTEEAPSLADDWEPMWLAHADSSAVYWESLLPLLEAPQMSPAQALRLAKGFKQAQADLKLADRGRGIRRYRMAVYGA